jgi:hypothetical protein
MAVTLPDRSPLASREASRARAVKAPGAANVPQVAQARDPGLNAPAGAFGSGLEGAGEGLERAVDAYAAAEKRARDVDDTVARTKAIEEYNLDTSKRVNDFNSAGDPTDDEQLNSVYGEMATKRKELMERNSGMSAASLARLDASLSGISTRGSTTLAEMKINAGQALLEKRATAETGTHALAAFNDPTKLFDHREKARASIDAVADGLSPGKVAALRSAADAAVVEAGFRGTLKLGRVGAAAYLNQQGIAESLGAAKTIALRDAIKDAPRPARILSPAETRAMGISQSGVVVQEHEGELSILFKPAPKSDGNKVRDDKVASARNSLDVSRPELTDDERQQLAEDMTDGRVEIKMNLDGSGARIINLVTGTVTELPIAAAGDVVDATKPPLEKQSLATLVADNNVAGLAGGFSEAAAGTLGQVSSTAVDQELLAARQEVVSSIRELARGLSVSANNPIREMERILKNEIPMNPSVFKSKAGMLSAMVGFKRALEARLAGEMKLAEDPNMPTRARGFAKVKVHALETFLSRLGDPAGQLAQLEADTLPAGVPEGSVYTGQMSKKHPTMGIYKTKEGKSVYGKRK